MPDSKTIAREIKQALESAGNVQFNRGADYGHITEAGIETIAKVLDRHYQGMTLFEYRRNSKGILQLETKE